VVVLVVLVLAVAPFGRRTCVACWDEQKVEVHPLQVAACNPYTKGLDCAMQKSS
jgi:hypothetical protein